MPGQVASWEFPDQARRAVSINTNLLFADECEAYHIAVSCVVDYGWFAPNWRSTGIITLLRTAISLPEIKDTPGASLDHRQLNLVVRNYNQNKISFWHNCVISNHRGQIAGADC